MLKNYFRITWRNLRRNKLYSFINIAGLAVGMAVALLIALWIVNEYSYDKFLPNYKQVYQVERNGTLNNNTMTIPYMPLPLSDVLKKEVPEIKYVAETDVMREHGLKVEDKKLNIAGIFAGDDFLKIFQFPMLKGNPATALNDIYSIVLTESTAKSLFGSKDPINQLVRFDNEHDLKVTGILKNLPSNSSFSFHYIVPFDYSEQTNSFIKEMRTTWQNNFIYLYIELKPSVTQAQLQPKIKNIIVNKNPEASLFKTEVILHPLEKWRLYSNFKNGKPDGGYIDYVTMFGTIGILVLLIACINFTNLSTARSVNRAKEVAIRKTIGAQRGQLIKQFLFESILMTFISFFLCLVFVQLSLPFFNQIIDDVIHIPFGDSLFWTLSFIYIVLTGVLAGSRPAFYLSAFNPVKVLKGSIQSNKPAVLTRKLLVVLQFTCSVALIISALIIFQQIKYARDRPIGYKADRMMTTEISNDLYTNYDALKNELMQTGMVENIVRSSSPLTAIGSHPNLTDWPGKTAMDEEVMMGKLEVSLDYFNAVGMEFKLGSNFLSTDTTAVIVNEAAIATMNLSDPLGKVISWRGGQGHIVGVVKNAILESPFTPVIPVIYQLGTNGSDAGVILYRLLPTVKTADAIATFTKIFDKYNPAYPYSFSFVDENYDLKFKLETLVGKLAGILAGLAVFISCLGLFGLAAYTAEQRKKEIGVRKVLGASITQLWMLICKDFIVLIIISCIIASPLAFYFLQNWLQKYEYRISIGAGVFILSAVAALCITIATISFQAIKAATANPVKNLRTE
jgi:ABC-type antimicrobial peptide transport system permease subunit